MEDGINALYNWPRFYRALCRQGPNLLLGVDEDLREIIKMSASTTDMFWSEGLQELLAVGAADGDMRAGVLSVLELWRENVLETLIPDSSKYGDVVKVYEVEGQKLRIMADIVSQKLLCFVDNS